VAGKFLNFTALKRHAFGSLILFTAAVLLPVIFLYLHPGTFDNAIALKKGKLLFNTFYLASVAAFFSTVTGLGAAYFYTRLFRRFNIVAWLTVLPLLVSTYVWAAGWKQVFTAISVLPDNPYMQLPWIYVTLYTPLTFLIITAGFYQISPAYEESALPYCRSFCIFKKIHLPLLQPSLRAAFLLVFLFVLSDFDVPSLFNFPVVSREIFLYFAAFHQETAALRLTMGLSLPALAGAWLLYRPVRQLDFRMLRRNTPPQPGRLRFLSAVALIWWVLLAVLVPVAFLFGQALRQGMQPLIESFRQLSPSAFVSFRVAFIAVLLMFIWALPVAVYVYLSRKKKDLSFPYLLAFIVPSVVLGIAFIRFYSRPPFARFYPSMGILALAMAGKYTFIIYKILQDHLRALSYRRMEAALLRPVSVLRIIRKILLPGIYPALLTAFVTGMLLSFRETALSLLLYPPGNQPLAVGVFTLTSNASAVKFASYNAAALIWHLALLLVLMGLFRIFTTAYEKRN